MHTYVYLYMCVLSKFCGKEKISIMVRVEPPSPTPFPSRGEQRGVITLACTMYENAPERLICHVIVPRKSGGKRRFERQANASLSGPRPTLRRRGPENRAPAGRPTGRRTARRRQRKNPGDCGGSCLSDNNGIHLDTLVMTRSLRLSLANGNIKRG